MTFSLGLLLYAMRRHVRSQDFSALLFPLNGPRSLGDGQASAHSGSTTLRTLSLDEETSIVSLWTALVPSSMVLSHCGERLTKASQAYTQGHVQSFLEVAE